MPDIVERLRDLGRYVRTPSAELQEEAATEIELLRGQVSDLKQDMEHHKSCERGYQTEIELLRATVEFYRTHLDAASRALGELHGSYELSVDDPALREYARLRETNGA